MSHLLTVLLPTLNAEAHLMEALDSLAAQTLKDFRVLLLDGGSTDSTTTIAEKYEALSVQVIHCGRIGLGGQLRTGLELVEGPLVARMDADDVSLPTRFEKQMQALNADPDVAIVGSQIELLAGSTICRGAGLPLRQQQIRTLLMAGVPAFCHPSVMFRADAARRSRAYSISGLGEDLDFYLRMTEAGTGRNLSEVLHHYRLHSNSASFRSFEEVRRNYSYGLECAEARRQGRPEPSATDHLARWSQRSLVQRAAARLESFGVMLYRKSRILLAQRKFIAGTLGVLLSLLIRPQLVFAKLRLIVGFLREDGPREATKSC